MPSETRRIKYLYCVIAHPLSNGGWQVRFTRNSKLDCTKHPNQNTFHDELYFLATTYNYGTNDASIMRKALFSQIRWHFFQFESMILLFLKCQRFDSRHATRTSIFDIISIVITGLPFDTFFTENAVAIHASCSK